MLTKCTRSIVVMKDNIKELITVRNLRASWSPSKQKYLELRRTRTEWTGEQKIRRTARGMLVQGKIQCRKAQGALSQVTWHPFILSYFQYLLKKRPLKQHLASFYQSRTLHVIWTPNAKPNIPSFVAKVVQSSPRGAFLRRASTYGAAELLDAHR